MGNSAYTLGDAGFSALSAGLSWGIGQLSSGNAQVNEEVQNQQEAIAGEPYTPEWAEPREPKIKNGYRKPDLNGSPIGEDAPCINCPGGNNNAYNPSRSVGTIELKNPLRDSDGKNYSSSGYELSGKCTNKPVNKFEEAGWKCIPTPYDGCGVMYYDKQTGYRGYGWFAGVKSDIEVITYHYKSGVKIYNPTGSSLSDYNCNIGGFCKFYAEPGVPIPSQTSVKIFKLNGNPWATTQVTVIGTYTLP